MNMQAQMMVDITAATTMATMGKVIPIVHITSLHPVIITMDIVGAQVIIVVAIPVVITMEHLLQPVVVEHLLQPVVVEHLLQPAN
jgi:hypothetical protein